MRDVLATVGEGVPGHHFGPPFVTAYQLAIALDREYPQIREALAHEVGGEGTATGTASLSTSLASCPGGSISIPTIPLKAACCRMQTWLPSITEAQQASRSDLALQGRGMTFRCSGCAK